MERLQRALDREALQKSGVMERQLEARRKAKLEAKFDEMEAGLKTEMKTLLAKQADMVAAAEIQPGVVDDALAALAPKRKLAVKHLASMWKKKVENAKSQDLELVKDLIANADKPVESPQLSFRTPPPSLGRESAAFRAIPQQHKEELFRALEQTDLFKQLDRLENILTEKLKNQQ